MEGLHLVNPPWQGISTTVRDVDPHEGSSGGAGFQVESRRPLRGVIGRVLEAKARASHQLESRLSESPESWTGDADRAWVSRFDGGSAGRGNVVTSKRCGLVTTLTRVYIGGRGKVKHLQIAITCVARAMCGVTETDCSCTASISSSNSEHRKFEFNQVMNASWRTNPVVSPDYYSTPYDQTVEDETTTCPEDEDLIVIPEKFRHIFYGNEDSELVFAGMANPSKDPEELGMLTVDCGASTTISKSLFNMTDIEPKVVTIQLAMDGMTSS